MRWIWFGIMVLIAGMIWDISWHTSGHIDDDLGRIPPAHWLEILGMFVSFIASLFVLRTADKTKKWVANSLVFSGFILLVGTLWDNVGYHLRGIDPGLSPPHVMEYVGFFSLLFFSVVATFVKRRKVEKRQL